MRKSVHSEGLKAFCHIMAEARNRAGLTQQKLAGQLKKHQSFVAKYENGERRIDVIEFITIARAMGEDPVSLLQALARRLK